MNKDLRFAGEWTEYDLRLNYFIDKHKFDAELVFSFKLPYLLPKLNESYCVKVIKNSFDSDLLNQTDRYIAFSGSRHWVDDQKTAARYSTLSVGGGGNTVLITEVVVAIQINRIEFDSIANLFSLQVDELKAELNAILQNVVEIIAYRYNEKSNGESFMFPTCMDCDRIHCGLYKNFIEKRLLSKQFIIANQPSPSGNSWDETAISTSNMENVIESWRYFKNKSNYEYKSNLCLESIISAAISIETYILSTVKSFCSSEESEIQYTSEKVTNENGATVGKFLTMTKLIKKLIDDKRIVFSKSKTKICNCVEKILTPRNDIMHGKLPVNNSWKAFAKNVNTELSFFYNNIVLENVSTDTEKGNVFLNWKEYQEYIERHTKNEFASKEERLANANEMCEKYPEFEYPKIAKIIATIELGDYEKAKVLQDEIMSETSNPDAAAIEFYIRYLNHKQFDFAIEVLTSAAITDANERIYTALAMTYHCRYQEKKDRMDLDNAVLMVEKAMQLSNKYALSFRLARDIYISCNNKTKIANISNALAQDKTNFDFSLFCALFYLNEQMYNDAESALRDFVDSLEKHPYEKYCMDYAIYENNLPQIINTGLEICAILRVQGKDMGDVIKQINSLSNRRLSGTKEYNTIGAFKGKARSNKPYQVTTPLPDLTIMGNIGNYIIKN